MVFASKQYQWSSVIFLRQNYSQTEPKFRKLFEDRLNVVEIEALGRRGKSLCADGTDPSWRRWLSFSWCKCPPGKRAADLTTVCQQQAEGWEDGRASAHVCTSWDLKVNTISRCSTEEKVRLVWPLFPNSTTFSFVFSTLMHMTLYQVTWPTR